MKRKRGMAGWMGEWGEGEKREQGWTDGGSEVREKKWSRAR